MATTTAAAKTLHNVDVAIKSIRERVEKLTWYNRVLFGFIGLVIIGGFSLVASAGSLATTETIDYFAQASIIQSGLGANERALSMIASKMQDKDRNDSELKKQLDAVSGVLAGIRESVNGLPKSLPDSKEVREADRQRAMISAVVIRITTGILLGFLVQVLLTVYRYNARLTAFYEARADALLVAGELDSGSLEKVAKLLFPERLDLDKIPESPSKQVIDMLKQLRPLSEQRSKSDGSNH